MYIHGAATAGPPGGPPGRVKPGTPEISRAARPSA